MGDRVFISHAAEDKSQADEAVRALESAGIRCWIAPRDVVPGQMYMESIATAVTDAALLVLVFSSNANDSRHVRQEVQHALESGVGVLPMRLDRSSPTGALAYALAGTHWLDATEGQWPGALQALPVAAGVLMQAGTRTAPPSGAPIAQSRATPASPATGPGRSRRRVTSPLDTVVVAARHAYPFYLDHGLYVCQDGRAFRYGLTHLAFYADQEVKPIVPRILLDVDHVALTTEGVATVAAQHGDHGEELARRLTSLLAGPGADEGARRHVFLLSWADDPETIRLDGSIPNDTLSRSGKIAAFTMGQRYVTLASLQRVARARQPTSALAATDDDPELTRG